MSDPILDEIAELGDRVRQLNHDRHIAGLRRDQAIGEARATGRPWHEIAVAAGMSMTDEGIKEDARPPHRRSLLRWERFLGDQVSPRFAHEVNGLPRCEGWSLDQLERCIWVLAGRRQLERFALLGCWPSAADRFVCVLRHPVFGTVGIVVQRDPQRAEVDAAGVDVAVREAVEAVVLLNAPDVDQWHEQGWSKAGVVWNADPTDLVTPWDESRPPQQGDALVRPGDRQWWHVEPPSTSHDPWWAAVEDLRSWAEHPIWGSTFLSRRVLTPTEDRPVLRLAACWLIAPDCYAYVEAVIWPTGPIPVYVKTPAEFGLPGQRYLRIGETLPASPCDNFTIPLRTRHWEMSIEHGLPATALKGRVLRDGIAWYDLHNPDQFQQDQLWPLDQKPLDRMALVLHHSIDQSDSS